MDAFKQLKDVIEKSSDKLLMAILFAMSFALRLYNLYNTVFTGVGLQYGGDTIRYNQWANEIAQNGLGYYTQNIDKPYYWGYPTVLYLCRKIFGTDLSALIVNILATSIAVMFLYKIAVMLTKSKTIAFLACIIYAYSPQIMKWDDALYSDNLRLLLVITVFYLYFLQMQYSGKKRAAILIILLLTSVIFFTISTTSSITLIYIAICLILQLPKKKRTILFAVLAIAAAALLAIMLLNSHGEHGLISRIKYYISLFEDGTIVYETSTFVYPVHEQFIGTPLFALDVIGIIFVRMIFFWAICFKTFPIYEKILSYVFLLPLIITGFMGMLTAIKKKQKQLYSLIGFIFTTNAVQSFFEIDGAHRYRLPVLPFMMILSAYFLFSIGKRLCVRSSEK